MKYRAAPEVQAVAAPLIEEHHAHLGTQHIEYLMTEKAPNSKGRELPGRARVISGINAVVARHVGREWTGGEPFFVMEVSLPWWNMLTGEQRKGLVEHLLYHMQVNLETGALSLEPPEFGEYPEVLDRYGFWHPSGALKRFAFTVAEQLLLLPDEEVILAGMDSELARDIRSGRVEVEMEGGR